MFLQIVLWRLSLLLLFNMFWTCRLELISVYEICVFCIWLENYELLVSVCFLYLVCVHFKSENFSHSTQCWILGCHWMLVYIYAWDVVYTCDFCSGVSLFLNGVGCFEYNFVNEFFFKNKVIFYVCWCCNMLTCSLLNTCMRVVLM